jgi:hypothetical protein
MATITQMIERLERVNPQTALVAAVNQTKEQYEDLLRSQLAAGKTKDGANIEPAPYSKAYGKLRQKEGLQIAFIDLKRKGNYYAGMTAEVEGTKIKLWSTVSYEQFISKRYDGPGELYGLTESNMEKYREIVRPVLQAEAKAQYNG